MNILLQIHQYVDLNKLAYWLLTCGILIVIITLPTVIIKHRKQVKLESEKMSQTPNDIYTINTKTEELNQGDQ